MLKTRHISQYRDLAILFSRYGLKDFKLQTDPDELFVQEEAQKELEPDVRARARAFSASLRSMGPSYIKFGQVLSTRPDLVPQEYIEELESLQDDIAPFSYAEVEAIVETELKARISKLFESFDVKPLAAASLGQVHRAMLRDGREVVVKIQRPNIRPMVEEDLKVFQEIAEFLEGRSTLARKMNLVSTVQQVKKTFLSELSYLQEAHNTEMLGKSLAEFDEIEVPGVIRDYSTDHILTTELVKGKKVSKLTPLELIDHDYADLAAVLTRAYLKQICVDGFWHSDPHPGNVFVRDGRLVLLDFGMASRISGEFQDLVIKLLLSITANRGHDVADACIKMSVIQDGFDREKFVKEISSLVTTFQTVETKRVNTGALIFHVISLASSNELKVPSELAMLAKTLLHLDGITRKLDPDYDPQTVIQDYAESLLVKKLRQKFHPRNFYTSMLDLNQLAIDLPSRARDLVDQAVAGRLTFTHKLDDAEDLLRGMHKIANRITVGLVIAALIIGSSLMLRVPAKFTMFGYPAIAVVGYLAASAIGFYLVISTLMSDRADRHRARQKSRTSRN